MRVVVLVPVIVFVPLWVSVSFGDEEEDFDEEDVFVDVFVVVIVLVEVGDGVTRDVGNEERESVVVFVDVFDSVDEDVGTMPMANSLGCKEIAEHTGGSYPLIPRRAVKSNRALISVILYNFP